VDGIDVEDVDRDPRKALARLARRPVLCARLVGSPAIRRRAVRALRDDWEYAALDLGDGSENGNGLGAGRATGPETETGTVGDPRAEHPDASDRVGSLGRRLSALRPGK
jgi:hypothetical protein